MRLEPTDIKYYQVRPDYPIVHAYLGIVTASDKQPFIEGEPVTKMYQATGKNHQEAREILIDTIIQDLNEVRKM